MSRQNTWARRLQTRERSTLAKAAPAHERDCLFGLEFVIGDSSTNAVKKYTKETEKILAAGDSCARHCQKAMSHIDPSTPAAV